MAPDAQQVRHVDDLLRAELGGDLREHRVDGVRGGGFSENVPASESEAFDSSHGAPSV